MSSGTGLDWEGLWWGQGSGPSSPVGGVIIHLAAEDVEVRGLGVQQGQSWRLPWVGLGWELCLVDTPASLQTVEHGFPNQPSALAFDPELRIMAIGTRSGAVKMYPLGSWLMCGAPGPGPWWRLCSCCPEAEPQRRRGTQLPIAAASYLGNPPVVPAAVTGEVGQDWQHTVPSKGGGRTRVTADLALGTGCTHVCRPKDMCVQPRVGGSARLGVASVARPPPGCWPRTMGL